MYNPSWGSESVSACKLCDPEEYCPAGAAYIMDASHAQPFAISCTDPWFEDSQDIDLEGSFYINQGLLILLLCAVAVALSLCAKFFLLQSVEFLSRIGEWMWEMEEEEPHFKKIVWGVAAVGALFATIMLIAFTFYIYTNSNTYIQTQIDVQNSAANQYPEGFELLSGSPLYININMTGRFLPSFTMDEFVNVNSTGFFNETTGDEIVINSLSRSEIGETNAWFQIEIPESFSNSPTVVVDYFSLLPGQFVHEIFVQFSTALNEDGQLKTCQKDRSVSQNQDLTAICEKPGFAYGAVSLIAQNNQTLRGAATINVAKTMGIVENCKPHYNSNPFSFATTQQSCSWCNSSTMLLFPSVVQVSLQHFRHYYEQTPSMTLVITFETSQFVRTASISQYLSFGSALLLLLVTSMGLQELFEITLAFGWWIYSLFQCSQKRIEKSQGKYGQNHPQNKIEIRRSFHHAKYPPTHEADLEPFEIEDNHALL